MKETAYDKQIAHDFKDTLLDKIEMNSSTKIFQMWGGFKKINFPECNYSPVSFSHLVFCL